MSSVLSGLSGLAGRFGGEALGFGTGTALARSLEPEATELAQASYALNPILVLDPGTLARLVLLERMQLGEASGEATASGINGERLQHIIDSLKQVLPTGETLELFRRGEISEDEARTALHRLGFDERYVNDYLKLTRVLLSPNDLAMARQQGFIDAAQARERSALQGVDAADSELLFELSGLPPGAEQMIELWRRGEVTEERVRQSLIEGHIKIKYADDVLKLRYQPLSASVAAEALIRQRIPEAEAVAIAEKNGIKRDDFLLWSNMLGRPIATGQALTLARRGEFTFEQFKEAVARSDVRTEYADDLWKLKRVIPPLFQIVRLLQNGSITAELATRYVIEEGYDKELAAAIVHAGNAHKTQRTRDLTAAQVDAIYESGLESQEWAIKQLTQLGYDESEAQWHVELLDARRLLAALQAALNTIHRTYAGHKIDRLTASNELDLLGVRTSVRDDLLETWTHEREANVARLTNAQIGRALKQDIITPDDAIARWIENGYSEDDANVLAALAKHPRTGTNPTGSG